MSSTGDLKDNGDFLSFRFTDSKPVKQIWQWCAIGSLLFHLVAVLIIFILLPGAPKLSPPHDTSINIQIVVSQKKDLVEKSSSVSEQAASTIQSTAISPEFNTQPKKTAPPPEVKREEALPEMTTARQLYSEKILSDPKNNKVRKVLNSLSADEHMIQLCNTEAMEQVHRSNITIQPDYLVAYAMADPKIHPNAIEVNGGAFRSKGHWFNIQYNCSVTSDVSGVLAFAYRIGTEIPKNEWQQHNLTADDGPAE